AACARSRANSRSRRRKGAGRKLACRDFRFAWSFSDSGEGGGNVEREEARAGMPGRDVQAVGVVHGEIGGLAGRDIHLLAVDGELERRVERQEGALGVGGMMQPGDAV